MERHHAGQSAQAELFGGLLVGFAGRALDFGRRSEMLGPSVPLQAVYQRFWSNTTMRCCFAQVQRNVPKRIVRGGHSVAGLAHHIALQHAREDLVNDAITLAVAMRTARVAGIGSTSRARAVALAFVLRLCLHAVPMQHVQSGDEELVRILLLVAGQVLRMVPN